MGERRTAQRIGLVGLLVAVAGNGCSGSASGGPPEAGGQGGSASFAEGGSGQIMAGASGVADAGGAGTGGETLPQSGVEQLDLLFMVDNSRLMRHKQEVLRSSVSELLSQLVNPPCVSADGQLQPPPVSGADCPQGQRRALTPIIDLHVGVIPSSLGDVGANASCPSAGFPNYLPERIDMAHLMGSLERSGAKGNAQGFLEWRAGSDIEDVDRDLQRMLMDAGETGCGWEASLESWYRFLIDPLPYRELARVQCANTASTAANCVQPATGPDDRVLVDDVLLAQRAAFLRPKSLVAIVMLTDENDCSAQVGNQTWVAFNTQDTRPMFKGSSTCAEDANAKCCYPCLGLPPEGCQVDPACSADSLNPSRLAPELDGQNLRCYDQKRRFGVDFLYPTLRYVNALSQRELCWNSLDFSVVDCDRKDVRTNPLYEYGRPRSRVFLTGILGVPWQAISTDQDATGRPIADARVLRFKSYEELSADGAWSGILGSPGVPWRPATESQPEQPSSPGSAPTLPQMLESAQYPRPGVVSGNAVNGRDFDTTQGTALSGGEPPRQDDLQYACIFPLPEQRDCAVLDPAVDNCDCYAGVFDRPLCEQLPGTSPPGTTQYWDKAQPGLRQLQVLKDFGANSVVASICARNTSDASAPDFGYRPALSALFERLSLQAGQP